MSPVALIPGHVSGQKRETEEGEKYPISYLCICILKEKASIQSKMTIMKEDMKGRRGRGDVWRMCVMCER